MSVVTRLAAALPRRCKAASRGALPAALAQGATATAAACAVLLAACTVGPDYHRPDAASAPAWRTDSAWREAQPSHAPLALDWWRSFNEPQLDTLEQQALAQNQTLAAASAHYAQARATLASTA